MFDKATLRKMIEECESVDRACTAEAAEIDKQIDELQARSTLLVSRSKMLRDLAEKLAHVHDDTVPEEYPL